jgi:hypothetical protein
MNRTVGLLWLLPFLLLFASSCSVGAPSERKLEEFVLSDGTKIKCYMPPPEVIAKGGTANVDLTVLRLGKLLEARGGGGLDVERIRQELPPEVSAFEAVEFRICAEYGNGVLSKQAYQAFTEQIIPAYTKNPPAKTVSTAGTTASSKLVEACGPSFTTTRPAEKFVPYWASQISRLQQERNIQHHDLQNLMLVRGRAPVDAGGIDPFEEINFTLDCLERIGYLKTEKNDSPNNVVKGVIGPVVENRKIIFLKPSLTIP